MGIIQDESGKPLQSEEPVEGKTEEKTEGGNGQSHGMDRHDVRGLPTGTILYNLIRVVGEEVGLEGIIRQVEVQKAKQKIIGDPPELVKMKEVYEEMVTRRFVFANELNQRFKGVDEARRKELGIEIFVPKGDQMPAAAAETPTPTAENEGG